MKLYSAPGSGNSYKARLLFALNGIDYELVNVDMANGQHKSANFLKINPRGQVPALVDGDVTLWDSQGILVYIARRFAPDWLPLDPGPMGEVMQWMAVAENECIYGMARARAVIRMNRPWNMEEVQAHGSSGLKVVDGRLNGRDWLVGDRPTLADVAVFPYVALAPEGKLPLDGYPGIQAWIARIKALPGFVGMPGIDAAA